jgi:hypothetical protein
VGSIIDARQGPLGTLSFIASDAPIGNLRLNSTVAGHLLNGRSLEGFSFAADIDGDGAIRDHSAVSLTSGLRSLKVSGSIAGDVVVLGSLSSLQTTGALTGDLLIGGSAGTVTIGGDLGSAGGQISIGGDLNRLTVSSRLGAANLLGDLEVGGSARGIAIGSRTLGGSAQGDIEVWGLLRNLTVAGALTGDVTAHSDLTRATVGSSAQGDIEVWGALRNLTVAGAVTGELTAHGDLTRATVGGDLGSAGGRVSIGGNLGRLSLSSRLGPANLLADLEVVGSAQAISIGSPTLGGSAQGDIEVWGLLRNLTVAGAVTGDVTAHSDLTRATVGGDLGSAGGRVSISGNLGRLSLSSRLGPADLLADLEVVGSAQAISIGSPTLGGDVRGEIEVWGLLRNLTVAGAVTGDVTAHGDLTRATVGGDLGTQSSAFHVGGALGNLTVGTRTAPADLVGELVVTGKLSNLAVSRDVRGAVTVGGNLTTFTAQHIASAITVAGDLGTLSTTSTIGPGVSPVDAVFTNNPQPTGSLTVTGTIGKLRQLT